MEPLAQSRRLDQIRIGKTRSAVKRSLRNVHSSSNPIVAPPTSTGPGSPQKQSRPTVSSAHVIA